MAISKEASIPFVESQDLNVEHDTFASDEMTPTPSKLVIATFNIRYAVGSFLISGSILRRLGFEMPRRRPNLVAYHIRLAALALTNNVLMPRVDILALQEADKETDRAGRVHVARELARKLGMYYAHAPQMIPRGEEQKSKQWYLDFEEHLAPDESGDTGLAMLSRFPFHDTTRIELPWSECAWRPRLAMKSVVHVGQMELTIFNAHIDPHASTDDQLEQHKAIIASAQNSSGPTVLLGDYNTLTSESRLRMRGLLEASGYSTPFRDGVATWRAGLIRLQPDWIFVRNAHILRFGVAKPLRVSDHWPVWIELALDHQGEESS